MAVNEYELGGNVLLEPAAAMVHMQGMAIAGRFSAFSATLFTHELHSVI